MFYVNKKAIYYAALILIAILKQEKRDDGGNRIPLIVIALHQKQKTGKRTQR
jgi:hypothetical protein